MINGNQTALNPFEISKEVEIREETDASRDMPHFVPSDGIYDHRSTKGTDRMSAQTGFYSKETNLPLIFGEARHNSTGMLDEPTALAQPDFMTY